MLVVLKRREKKDKEVRVKLCLEAEPKREFKVKAVLPPLGLSRAKPIIQSSRALTLG